MIGGDTDSLDHGDTHGMFRWKYFELRVWCLWSSLYTAEYQPLPALALHIQVICSSRSIWHNGDGVNLMCKFFSDMALFSGYFWAFCVNEKVVSE